MEKTIAQALAPSSSATTTRNIDPDPISLDAYEPSLVRVVASAGRFAAGMRVGMDPRWLTLSGVPGCGKTHTARQILGKAAQSNPGNGSIWMGSAPRPRCLWIDASVFGQRVKGGDYGLPASFGGDWCVVFDDLGAEYDKSGFLADAIYRFCNARLGKWTVFTTNYTLGEIADRLDQRIASRLIRDGSEFLKIEAGDYALR